MASALGITGPSGGGKSTLARAVREALGPARAALLREDDYYRDLAHLEPAARAAADFDDPAALELDLLAAHVAALKAGRPVAVPVYDFATHARVPGRVREVAPRPLVLVEGLLLGAAPAVRAALDRLVYVDAPAEVRLARRLARDVAQRGRTAASVARQWREQVLPAEARYVAPWRNRADLVVAGDGELGAGVAAVLALVPGGGTLC